MYAQFKILKGNSHRRALSCFMQKKSRIIPNGSIQKSMHKYAKYAEELSSDLTGEGKILQVKEGRLKYKVFEYEGARILEIMDLISDRFTQGAGVRLLKKVMEIGKEAGCSIVRLIAESSGLYGRPGQTELIKWYANRGLHTVKPGGTFGRWMVGEIEECLTLINGTLARYSRAHHSEAYSGKLHDSQSS